MGLRERLQDVPDELRQLVEEGHAVVAQRSRMGEVRDAVADDRVFLVDVAQEHVRRNHPEVTDVEQNDMYWILAGWS